MAGVEDGLVVVLGALVQAVAAGFAVPHLRTWEEPHVITLILKQQLNSRIDLLAGRFPPDSASSFPSTLH